MYMYKKNSELSMYVVLCAYTCIIMQVCMFVYIFCSLFRFNKFTMETLQEASYIPVNPASDSESSKKRVTLSSVVRSQYHRCEIYSNNPGITDNFPTVLICNATIVYINCPLIYYMSLDSVKTHLHGNRL